MEILNLILNFALKAIPEELALGKTSWCETKQAFIIFTISKG